jgi:hypothetical protein
MTLFEFAREQFDVLEASVRAYKRHPPRSGPRRFTITSGNLAERPGEPD